MRLGYPAAFVELAVVLSGQIGARAAASMLDLNLGTIYRWLGRHRNVCAPSYLQIGAGRANVTTEIIGQLCGRCSAAGYPLRASDRTSVLRLDNDAFNSWNASVIDTPRMTRTLAVLRCAEATYADVDGALVAAKKQIDSDYRQNLSCSILAMTAGLPRVRFIKEFRSAFGVSPYQYLLGVRVHHARRQLERCALPLHEIAASCGFGSSTSMQRAFRHFLGVSPSKALNTIFCGTNSAAESQRP